VTVGEALATSGQHAEEAAQATLGSRAGASARPTLAQRLFDGTGWRLLRLGSDAVLLALATVFAQIGAPDSLGSDGSTLIYLFPPLVLGLLASRGLYDNRTHTRILDGLGKFVAATALATVVLIAGAAFVDPDSDPALLLGRAWLFGTAMLIAGRFVLEWAQRRGRASGVVAKPTLIIGAGVVGAHVERHLSGQPQLGLRPIGYLDADPPPEEMVPDRHAPVLGRPEDVEWAVRETGAEHVVFGFLGAPDSALIPLIQRAENLGCEVSFVPRLFESVNVHVKLEHLGGLPLFGVRSIDPKGWQFTVKHAVDRLAAGLLALLLAPVLLFLTIAVRLSSRGPILFRQVRVGRDGREFEMLKFRSMAPIVAPPARDAPTLDGEHGTVVAYVGDVAPGGVEGADRRTLIGSFMRATSLDELPQLFNVLRGDMSLVGPRPERPEFVDVFGSRIEHYDHRHRVKSGITGWAQVNGLRGKTSLRDRVEWDNFYIENWTLALDLKILLMTVVALFHRAE
jgi:exopolysaccharide biosynthesis polyprenyl glycosylphosphotransferase